MKTLSHLLPVIGVLLSVSMALADELVRFVEPDAERGRSAAVLVRDSTLAHTAQVLGSPNLSMDEQINQVIATLDKTLARAESSLARTIKLNVYVTAPNIADQVDRKLAKVFNGSHKPAVSWVTTRFPDPKTRVAMDAVGISRNTKPTVEGHCYRTHCRDEGCRVSTLPIGPRVYISGQAEKGDGSLAGATRETMAGLIKTLNFLGLSTRDVVHLKAFVQPYSNRDTVVSRISLALQSDAPPISVVEWESSIFIEIELIAAAPVQQQTRETPSIEFLTPPWMKASPVFCRIVRVNHPATIFISGLYGATDSPDSVEEVRDLYGSLRRIAEASGSDLQHLAKATYYVSTDEVSNQLNVVRPEFYDPERPPSASKAKVRGTGRTGRTITLDMIAVPKGL